MKVIIIIMLTLFGLCSNKEKEANEKFITLCKVSDNVIIVDYLDSTHGISNIKQTFNKDTLILSIYVSFGKEQKGYEIKHDTNIKFISIGKTTFEIIKIGICGNIKSGKEALNQFKTVN